MVRSVDRGDDGEECRGDDGEECRGDNSDECWSDDGSYKECRGDNGERSVKHWLTHPFCSLVIFPV